MSSEIFLRLTLTSTDQDPDEVTAFLGVPPDLQWRPGDPVSSTVRAHQNNGWQLRSKVLATSSLEAHLRSLRSRLPARPLPDCWSVELSCAIYTDREAPPMTFDAETVQWLSGLKASIDVDIYPLGALD